MKGWDKHEALVEPLDLHIHHVDTFPLENSLQISQIEYSDRPRWFVWWYKKIMQIEMHILRELKFKYKTHSPKPRSCQMVQKSIFQYFFDEKLTEKRIRQNQDLAKSCKNQFFNTFLIRNWIEKNAFAKTKILPNAAKINFSFFFD